MILVPTDFTSVAECALNHALKLASILKVSIGLLHIVESDKLKNDALEKLNLLVEANSKDGITIEAIVEKGNIFEDIGRVAKEKKARFIIMGTHGVKGLQHITGSYALKVITNSNVPFIVVQDRKIKDGYKNIISPLDLSDETKQKIDITITMAQYFNSKIYWVAPHETDEFFAKKISNNLAFAQNECKKKSVNNEQKIFNESGNFVKQTLAYATSIDADLIAIINGQELGVHEYIAGTQERQFITNESQIPVMCINPVNVQREGSLLFFK
jgi:nucleotide-binding universal stress UspA family protein